MDLLVVIGAGALLGCLPSPPARKASAAPPAALGLDFGTPRPARSSEASYEDTLPLLREPENSNAVPGPNGFVAVVKADRQHHPRIYIVRPSLPDSLQLLIDRYATAPRWAPSGERLACTVWRSRAHPWALCLVTLGKPDTLYPLPDVNAVRYRWSPNAKYLAVSATLEGGAASVLYMVDAITAQARTLDTLRVYSDYGLAWSPDSRMLAVSRPTRLSEAEDVQEAEIWVFEVSGVGERAVPASGGANVEPRWVDSRRLLFSRHQNDPVARSETLILDVTPSQ